jgi:small subunit ribosomal protein S15
MILRDQYGVPLAKPIIGKTVTDVLKAQNLASALPEDLDVLLRKASGLVVHLERNRKDAYNKRALQTIEAKIHKLAKYYKREGVLPPEWKHEAKTASLT